MDLERSQFPQLLPLAAFAGRAQFPGRAGNDDPRLLPRIRETGKTLPSSSRSRERDLELFMSIVSIPSSHQHTDGARQEFPWKCFLGKSGQQDNPWNFLCFPVFSPGEHGELGVSRDERDRHLLSRDWKTWEGQILLKKGEKPHPSGKNPIRGQPLLTGTLCPLRGQNIPGLIP